MMRAPGPYRERAQRRAEIETGRSARRQESYRERRVASLRISLPARELTYAELPAAWRELRATGFSNRGAMRELARRAQTSESDIWRALWNANVAGR